MHISSPFQRTFEPFVTNEPRKHGTITTNHAFVAINSGYYAAGVRDIRKEGQRGGDPFSLRHAYNKLGHVIAHSHSCGSSDAIRVLARPNSANCYHLDRPAVRTGRRVPRIYALPWLFETAYRAEFDGIVEWSVTYLGTVVRGFLWLSLLAMEYFCKRRILHIFI